MNPLGFISLNQALIICGKKWQCDTAQAYERLRPFLHDGAVESNMILENGRAVDCRNYWGSTNSDNSYLDGMLVDYKLDPDDLVKREAFVRRKDIDKLLLGMLDDLIGDLPDLAPKPKDKGGRDPKFKWDEIWIEIVRMVHVGDGLPKQSDLIKVLTIFYEAKHGAGNAPGDTRFKEKLSPLYEKLGIS